MTGMVARLASPRVARGNERKCEAARHARDFTAGHIAAHAASPTVGAQKKAAEAAFFSSAGTQVEAGVFAAAFALTLAPRVYFCLNRSTRPAVSTIFWRPV